SLTTYHCNVIYTEELSSHKNKTTLKKMLLNLNKHDKIVVEKFYTIADSLKKLKEILNIIREKDAYILFIKENIDTSNVMEEKFNEYVQHLINLQGDIISENTKIGIKTAKNQGKNTGRPKKSLRNIQKAI
ncbi:recombinase family protein, partial [Salmonella enterica subsp. enterica serovar Typhi]|nr:recombinase family protein [Salmonella enterica subsp. enterica serovar Typhi]